MKLVIHIKRDGTSWNARVSPDVSKAIYCTPAARDELARRMHEAGVVCAKCGLVARTEELGEDKRCRDGVGCSADSDGAILELPDGVEKIARTDAMVRDLFTGFANMTRGPLRDLTPPSTEEPGSW